MAEESRKSGKPRRIYQGAVAGQRLCAFDTLINEISAFGQDSGSGLFGFT